MEDEYLRYLIYLPLHRLEKEIDPGELSPGLLGDLFRKRNVPKSWIYGVGMEEKELLPINLAYQLLDLSVPGVLEKVSVFNLGFVILSMRGIKENEITELIGSQGSYQFWDSLPSRKILSEEFLERHYFQKSFKNSITKMVHLHNIFSKQDLGEDFLRDKLDYYKDDIGLLRAVLGGQRIGEEVLKFLKSEIKRRPLLKLLDEFEIRKENIVEPGEDGYVTRFTPFSGLNGEGQVIGCLSDISQFRDYLSPSKNGPIQYYQVKFRPTDFINAVSVGKRVGIIKEGEGLWRE